MPEKEKVVFESRTFKKKSYWNYQHYIFIGSILFGIVCITTETKVIHESHLGMEAINSD